MKKIKYILIILIFIGLKTNAQDLTCADFKIGSFFIPTSDEMKNYTITTNDTISEVSTPRDLRISKYVVKRAENSQTEWINGIDEGNPEYEILEWIDDCTYRLTYDATKMELTDEKKWINDNNGIIVSKSKIEGKCMFYDAIMTTNDGQKVAQKGVICAQ